MAGARFEPLLYAFGALFVAFRRGQRGSPGVRLPAAMLLAASTIFWVVSSKEFALCSVTSIVRLSALIARKAGPIFWWCSWFVLLGLEMAREFWGLDKAEAVPFQGESTTICVGRSAGALGVGIGCALLDGRDLQDGTGNSCGRLDGAYFRFGRKAKITGNLVFRGVRGCRGVGDCVLQRLMGAAGDWAAVSPPMQKSP